MTDPAQAVPGAIGLERGDSGWVVRLAGDIPLAAAEELKAALLECVVCGRDFEVDLETVETMDFAVLQLLWAAARERERAGAAMAIRTSPTAAAAICEAGFGSLLGHSAGGR